jgi:transposase
MDRYIGLDAHSTTCTIGVMTATGKRHREMVVDTNGKVLVEAIKSIAGTKHLCLEEGAQSEWLYELLQPHVDEIVVTQPLKNAGQKSDTLDTWELADNIRTGSIKRPIFKAPGTYSALREAVRAHDVLTKDVTRCKNRLKALFRSRGISTPGSEIYDPDPQTREAWIKQLPVHRQKLAALLAKELDVLSELKNEAEKWLLEQAKCCISVKLLTSVPGIMWIRAAQIVATVISPNRFRTRQQFWSYCGLGIVTKSSSDWKRDRHGKLVRRDDTVKTRGLNMNRNPMLKAVFKGAASTIERMPPATEEPPHPLRAQYDQLIERGLKPSLARVTIARKIASIVLAIWKNKEEYDSTKSTTLQSKTHA